MKKILLLFIIIFVSFTAIAQDRYPFDSLQKQQQFERITKAMRCMVCENQSLATSTSGFADDMRAEIYKMIQAGKNDKEIASYMTKRYGYFILFKPPFTWETAVLWFLPLFLLLIGVIIARSVYKRYRGDG